MGQEFFINSEELETKIRTLLPSQGGKGAGFDLSASTQIVPIIDLTESAEGSNVRADLQTALSFNTVTAFEVTGSVSTTIINTTGYFRVFANFTGTTSTAGDRSANFALNDGATSKILQTITAQQSATPNNVVFPFDFIVFLEAGDSLIATTSSTEVTLSGSTRQIASIDGTLVNP